MTFHNIDKQIESLFNENFHSLVFASFRIVKNFEQAEDIVQNVFVKIWQNYDKIKNQKNLTGYLHTAVRNSSLNYLRDYQQIEKKRLPIDNIYVEEQEEDNEHDNKEELITKVHWAVDQLPEKWREAFILSKYEKLKYYEIAEKMNISDKTVEKYISKALSVLRGELKHLISIILIFIIKKL